MTTTLTDAERLKFLLLSDGLSISEEAHGYITAANGDRPMTPADYASTSGVILALDDDVWVNAPIVDYNANFVTAPVCVLAVEDGQLRVRGAGLESSAKFWLPPEYHGKANLAGEDLNSYAFTHADRVRISPIEGCSMVCKFCNLPYDFRYRTKRVEGLVDSVRRAIQDPVQPAYHVLISGGTPHAADIGYVRDVYEAVITGFKSSEIAGEPSTRDGRLPVDIMMVPIEELLDPHWLDEIGVNEISVNLEMFNVELAGKIMRSKAKQGLQHYVDYLERAAGILGPGRVRSMLMVGLEPLEDTLAGVEAIARRGCVPVLSPFRPDPATPLRDRPPPDAAFLEEAYLRARDVAHRFGAMLGPGCLPCSHNTLTLAAAHGGDADRYHGHPHVV